jgi:hypothetical protein
MPDSPARLSVSEIRQKVFEVSGRPSEGAGNLAGSLFHRVASCALDPNHPAYWETVLSSTLSEEEWLAALYEQALGPELVRLQPSLVHSGAEVLQLWHGTQQFVAWFCGLLREAANAGRLRYDGQSERWLGATQLFQSECDVERAFMEPGWSSPVIVCGRLDQFLRSGPDHWCVIEFKLGGGHPEADAAQVCLYRELLGGSGVAALVHFGGELQAHEILFPQRALEQTRPKLVALIGALAGVSGSGNKPTLERTDSIETAMGRPTSTSWPRKPGEDEAETGKRLERTLHEYGAEAQIAGEPLVGPAFVRYLLEPLRGVTVSQIEKRAAELQVRLQLDQEPIIHRVEGRIAVDVQRRSREFVSFDSVRAALPAAEADPGAAKVLAGVDLRGNVHFLDLARDCPHILVGGGTGSGKTEWLRSAVASLVVTHAPDSLRLAVIDPKKNAFPELAGSGYLWRQDALIDAPDASVLSLLEDLSEEMSRRYGLFKTAAADDLSSYRRKAGEPLARIVCIVDEFADLLMSGGRRQRDAFEECFIRIAQMGRASGIHLILATQRPSRQVISGNLKANLPGKIALRVSTRVDSGVLIDRSGAQNLLGKGDLLLAGLSSEPLRLQSVWLSEEERRSIFRALPVSTNSDDLATEC